MWLEDWELSSEKRIKSAPLAKWTYDGKTHYTMRVDCDNSNRGVCTDKGDAQIFVDIGPTLYKALDDLYQNRQELNREQIRQLGGKLAGASSPLKIISKQTDKVLSMNSALTNCPSDKQPR